MNGPDGVCFPDCVEVHFGSLPPLPDGYSVWWHGEHDHYQWHGPDETEGPIDVDRYRCRRGAIAAANRRS